MILAIESTGTTASAALYDGNRVLAEYSTNDKLTHSQTLLPMIDEIFRCTGLDKHAVTAVAVSRGPGSFTGLRIGAATAKGLGLALDVPLIPVSTLAALAALAAGTESLVCPMMDARRSQVYTAAFEVPGTGIPVPVTEEAALPAAEMAGKLNALGRPVVLLGDGAAAYRAVLEKELTVPFRFMPPHLNAQRAGAVAVLGAAVLEAGGEVGAADFVPVYLRASQAERERAKRIRREAGVSVRPAVPEDAAELARLEQACFGEEGGCWKEEDFAFALTEGASRYALFRADRDGEAAGYLCLQHAADEADVVNIGVLPECRRAGIGRALLLAGLQWMAEHEVSRVFLEVRAGNAAARGLYRKEGFAEDGVRKDYYRNPAEDAVLMSRSV